VVKWAVPGSGQVYIRHLPPRGQTGGKEAGIVAAEKEFSHGFCEVWKKFFNRGKEDEPRQRQKRR